MVTVRVLDRCTPQRLAIRLTALIVLLAIPRAMPAQQCPTATVLGNDGLRYRSRGAICDGRARVDWRTIGDAIVIVSIVGQVDPPTFARELYLYWKMPAGATQPSLALRGLSVPPGHNYQMDASPALAGAPLVWPADVMSGLGMDWSGVGVTGSVKVKQNAAPRVVYVPVDVRLTRQVPVGGCPEITVRAVAGTGLPNGVVLTLQEVDKWWLPIRGTIRTLTAASPVAAGTPIDFTTGCLAKSGTFQLEISPNDASAVSPATGFVVVP
jgi:hypothetical protein